MMKKIEFGDNNENIEIAKEAIEICNNSMDSNKDHRYTSWEICYSRFKEALKDNELKPNYDELALNLGFYLASWGMYRGSSFLLERNYKTHIEPIKELFQKENLRNFNKESVSDSDINDLVHFKESLASKYEITIDSNDNNDVSRNMTDTLFSKIILGVYGCIPAFDRFYKKGVGTYGGTQKLGVNSITEIYKFYNTFNKKFPEIKPQLFANNFSYPPMKLMDMCFFTIGIFISLNEECFKAQSPESCKISIAKYYEFIIKNNVDLKKYKDFLIEMLNKATETDKPEEIINNDSAYIKDFNYKRALFKDNLLYIENSERYKHWEKITGKLNGN